MAEVTRSSELSSEAAVDNLKRFRDRAFFPRRFRDQRTKHQVPPRASRLLLPLVTPGFTFSPGSRVFTIGSCFAREIEENLHGYDLPTRRLHLPRDEWPGRPNGVLNEYNPGSISQRIERAFAATRAPEETVVPHGRGGFIDLLLPGDLRPGARDRVFARRAEIDAIYDQLPRSEVLIVTLGLIEAWFDTQTGSYLNRKPPTAEFDAAPDRYVLRVFDVDDAYPMLAAAFSLLDEADLHVVVTVSPVPLYATFSGEDAIIANSLSKAVLRVCAHRLANDFSRVDYFPSFEIATSGGLANFYRDQLHVRSDVVSTITRYMVSLYERRD